jgi:hypothetical protein
MMCDRGARSFLECGGLPPLFGGGGSYAPTESVGKAPHSKTRSKLPHKESGVEPSFNEAPTP